jgi:uncharacterized ferredoxin-like protein
MSRRIERYQYFTTSENILSTIERDAGILLSWKEDAPESAGITRVLVCYSYEEIIQKLIYQLATLAEGEGFCILLQEGECSSCGHDDTNPCAH